MIDIEISADGAIKDLDARNVTMSVGLKNAARVLEDELLSLARAKAGGNVLAVHSGEYLDSLRSFLGVGKDGLVAGVSTDAPGAIALEYGADIPAHDILPTAGKALRFMGSAGAVYAGVIRYPGAHVAPHSVLRASLDEMRDRIIGTMERAVADAWSD